MNTNNNTVQAINPLFVSRFKGDKADIKASLVGLLKSNARGTMSYAAEQGHAKDSPEYKTCYLNANWILTQIQGTSSMKVFTETTRVSIMEQCQSSSPAEVIGALVAKMEQTYDEQGQSKHKAKVVSAEASFFASIEL